MTDTFHSITEIRQAVKYGSDTIPLVLRFPSKTGEDSCESTLKEEIMAILGRELSSFLSSEQPDTRKAAP